MNIKYKFNNNEKVSAPLTPANLFDTNTGGLYPMEGQIDLQHRFAQNIELINQRISGITKQLTYWDLYRLAYQVTSPNDLDATFAKLTPGQALIINCESFSSNNQSYHKGDVVVKMLDNEAAYIPAITGGIYYPDAESSGPTTEGGRYKLVYKYATSKPQDTIEIEVPQGDVTDSYIYGIFRDISNKYASTNTEYSESFDCVSYEDTPIRPYIKFFTEANEEIALSFSVTLSNNTWTVSWTDAPSTIKWMQVK